MNLTRAMSVTAGLVVLGGLGVCILVQRSEITRLKGLAAGSSEQGAGSQQRDSAQTTSIPSDPAEASAQAGSSSDDSRELLRLRAEVTQLRQQTKTLEKERRQLLAESQQLRQRLTVTGPRLAEAQGPDDEQRPPLKAWVGVMIQETPTGQVMIGGVYENSPALEAKLAEGDLVLSVNDQAITNVLQLRTMIGSSVVDQALVFHVVRDGVPLDFTVTPKPPPSALLFESGSR